MTYSGAKICGLSTAETVQACVDGGAAFIGFVFFEKSPRNVTPEQAAQLTKLIPASIFKVGLFVHQPPEEVAQIAKTAGLTAIQLHGTYKAEAIRQVKQLTGLPILWAHGISVAEDFEGIDEEIEAADILLFDAKPPKGSDRPGGNATSFDWSLLIDRQFAKPWMLAGGLTPDNVAEAIKASGAKMVDISSGVESAPGQKDPALMAKFLGEIRILSHK